MAKLTLAQVVESANKKFEDVEIDVPVYVDGVLKTDENGAFESKTVVLKHIMTVPRGQRKGFAQALELEAQYAKHMELPEDERPDADFLTLFVAAFKNAFRSVTEGGDESFQLLDAAFTNFDPSNPDAYPLWKDLFDTYATEVDLEKA